MNVQLRTKYRTSKYSHIEIDIQIHVSDLFCSLKHMDIPLDVAVHKCLPLLVCMKPNHQLHCFSGNIHISNIWNLYAFFQDITQVKWFCHICWRIQCYYILTYYSIKDSVFSNFKFFRFLVCIHIIIKSKISKYLCKDVQLRNG